MGERKRKQGRKQNKINILVVKCLAAITGTRTDFLGTKEKIEQGNLFKDLLDKALAMDPNEFTVGLHQYGMSNEANLYFSFFTCVVALLFQSPGFHGSSARRPRLSTLNRRRQAMMMRSK
jgi:hypothetical protein